MSNDKVAATVHPQRSQRRFRVGDSVSVKLEDGTFRVGEVETCHDFVGTFPRRYVVRFPEDETNPTEWVLSVFAAQVGPVPRVQDWSYFALANAQIHETVATTPEQAEDLLSRFRKAYPAYAEFADRYSPSGPVLPTTGEHIHHKLADDLYQDFISPRDVPEHHHELPEMSDAQVERLYEMVTHRGPGRSKMLTPTEITMALKIVGSIVLLFVFVVIFYRW